MGEVIDHAGPEVSIGDAAASAIRTIEQNRKERMSFLELSSLLQADFETGKLFWLPRDRNRFENEGLAKRWNTRYAGKEAFTALDGSGYLAGTISGRAYQAHRVLWLLHTGAWPEDQIDHINGCRTDNRLSNLRSVTQAENARNKRTPATNRSGVPGVCWDKSSGKWLATIKLSGKQKHLGRFEQFDDAVAARKSAEAEYGYHQNHGENGMNEIIEIQKSQQIAAVEQRQAMTPMEMISAAVANGASVETLERLMSLQERFEAGQARKAFDAAISAAKAEIPAIIRNATGHNNKRYADFSAIATVVDPILSKHGLSYRFRTTQTDKVTVTCVLSHKEGHSEETTLSGAPDTSGSKNAIQAIGSALTYLSRYSLMAALGLAATNDDDGRAAGASDKTITKEQAETILALLDETDSDIEQFCKMGNIDAVPQMLARDYENALRLLNQKKAKMSQRVAS